MQLSLTKSKAIILNQLKVSNISSFVLIRLMKNQLKSEMVLMPNSLRSFWNASTLRGFFSRSASWYRVPHNSKLTTPSLERSLRKWNLILMCLEQLCNTRFLDNLIIEALSHISFVPAAWTWLISFRILLIQIAWQAHAVAATNSAFVVYKVMIGCFRNDKAIPPPLIINT